MESTVNRVLQAWKSWEERQSEMEKAIGAGIEAILPAGEAQANFTLFFNRGEQGRYELMCMDCAMDNSP